MPARARKLAALLDRSPPPHHGEFHPGRDFGEAGGQLPERNVLRARRVTERKLAFLAHV